MEDYLVRGGCEDAVLYKNNGEQLAGQDLVSMVENTRKARNLIADLNKKAPEKIVEQKLNPIPKKSPAKTPHA